MEKGVITKNVCLEYKIMNCYIISYDVRNQHQELYYAIKGYESWAHINESVWAVVTTKSAKDVRDHLKSKIGDGDSIFVVKSGLEAAWSNVLCRDQWLKDNL